MLEKGKSYKAKIRNKEKYFEFYAVNKNTIKIENVKYRIYPTMIGNRFSFWKKEKNKGVTLEKQIYFEIIEK